eukprot:UN00310
MFKKPCIIFVRFRNDVPIPGANSSVLYFESATAYDDAIYHVEATNPASSVNSTFVDVLVYILPNI